MDNVDDLSRIELKKLVVESLKDVGIDPELIEIIAESSSKIILRGEIYSRTEGDLAVQTVTDISGIDNVVDEMEIIEDAGNMIFPENPDEDLLDEDNVCYGTEDMCKAVEDGVPYIPPMNSSFDKDARRTRKKQLRRETDIYW